MSHHLAPLLVSAEVAEILGVPTRTLDDWAHKRSGPRYVRVGRHRRYDPADLAAWIETQKRGMSPSR